MTEINDVLQHSTKMFVQRESPLKFSCHIPDALFKAGTTADETLLWLSILAVVAGWC